MKHSTIYGMGGVLTRFLGFILLPMYTRYLTPTDYGILSLLFTTGSVADILVRLGFGPAIFREVIYRESDERQVESTALYFLIGESAIFLAIFLPFSPLLSRLIFGTPAYALWLSLILASSLLGIVDAIAMAKLRIRQRSSLYAILSVVMFLIGTLLNIYFVAILRWGVRGLVICSLVQAAISAAISLALLVSDLKPTFSMSILRRLLSFGIPLVPNGLSRLIMTYADRYFLLHYSSAAEVGLYSLGYNIAMVLNLIVNAVQTAWPAQMFGIAKKPKPEKQLSRILTYYLVVLGFIGLGFSVLAHEVLMIMTTPRFHRAGVVVPLIVLSYVLSGIMYMTNSGLETRNKMRYLTPIIVASAALNLGLNYLLIPAWGMMGAASATFISYLFLTVAGTAVNLRLWFIPYEYDRIGKVAFVCGLIYTASLLIKLPNAWAGGFFKLLLLATYPLLLYVVRFYKEDELVRLQQILRSVRSRWYARRTPAWASDARTRMPSCGCQREGKEHLAAGDEPRQAKTLSRKSPVKGEQDEP